MIRKPKFAGSTGFYPSDLDTLNKVVEKYLSQAQSSKEKVKGVVAPHAGYVYSGKVAGLTYGGIKVPGRVIIIGPNHTGMGREVSVMDEGTWEIPGNSAEIDAGLAKKIIEYSSFAGSDTQAHLEEHSLEVQLPFILSCNTDIKFVPIIMCVQDTETAEDLGEAVGRAVKETGEDVLLVASSDMSHYVSLEDARRYDNMAIEKMKSLDYQGLIHVVDEENISMCGSGAVAAVIKACKMLGAEKGELVHYNTSAEAFGQTSRVVGYAGMKIL